VRSMDGLAETGRSVRRSAAQTKVSRHEAEKWLMTEEGSSESFSQRRCAYGRGNPWPHEGDAEVDLDVSASRGNRSHFGLRATNNSFGDIWGTAVNLVQQGGEAHELVCRGGEG